MRIGIGLPIGERGDPPRATAYREMRQLARLAEQGGLDSAWAADHLFIQPPDGPRRSVWESWTVLSALAEATERIELGPLVLCGPFRNPGLLAWMANTLDEVSDGRFVLGLGAGWHAPEFHAFGFEFDRRVTYLADMLEIVVPLLRAGKVEYDGQLLDGRAELGPRGPRPGGPPIMLAGSRPRMMALTARWADRFNTAWYGLPDDDYRADVDNLRAACAERGRDPAEIEITVGIEVLDQPPADQTATAHLHGPADQLAEGFASWRDQGVAELICRFTPASPAMVERIARAAELVRAG